MGELQLGQIIEDILTPSQYERGVLLLFQALVKELSMQSSCLGKLIKTMFIYRLIRNFLWLITIAWKTLMNLVIKKRLNSIARPC